MRKLNLSILCALCLLSLWLPPLQTWAVTPLETEKECSLRMDYSMEDTVFEGLTIAVYRVAEAFDDGTFELIAPFNSYPVNIHGITSQTEWQQVAETLKAYIVADQVEPTRTALTDADGMAHFTDLQTGLYLVLGVVAENETGMYRFRDFMVYLPTPQEDGGFRYDMEAKPKCTQFTPSNRYSVIKLWKDAGHEEHRPNAVTVDIFRDGVLQETVTLSPENNWTYSWNVPDGQGIWTVVERDVPVEYEVLISAQETAFVITNTHDTPKPPPETGDLFPVWLVVLALCLTGCALLLLGTRYERKRT